MALYRPQRVHPTKAAPSALILLICLHAGAASSTTLPSGFVESEVASGLVSPTVVAIAPDGRIFIAEQSGRVRLVKNGALLVTPFLQVEADVAGERGMLGLALDPHFDVNQYVYVYYSPAGLGAYRLSRFTADGDVALPGETILVDLPSHGGSILHFGGGLRFWPDGSLFLSVGDHLWSEQAPLLTSVFGKMLRFERDGSIPEDNPFFDSTSGLARAIWARGLRNPFTFDIHPATGRMLINDVGAVGWEEINEGQAGAHYGWPESEGPTDDPAFVGPVYAYSHFGTWPDIGCAVTGAAFYAPETPLFPPSYLDVFFFGDFCGKYIRYLDPATDRPVDFAFDLRGNVTDIDVGPDGSLYYLARASDGSREDDDGALYRISYTASLAPQITAQPESQTVLIGDPVTFVAAALEATAYQWQRDGVDLPGATSPQYTVPAVTLADDGAKFRLVASNEFGSTASSAAVLTVTTNAAPTVAITVDAPRERFFGGDVVRFSGTAEDPEDGALDASAFTWRVDFHHATHFHPFVASTGGVTEGEFTTATQGETSSDVWYRIHLRVEDSGGRVSATSEDVMPELATFGVGSEPPGLQLTLDGQPRITPLEAAGVVGLVRRLGAALSQTVGGATYRFERWSDGGEREHSIAVPPERATYTAFYTLVTTTTTTPATTTTSTTTTTTSSTTTTLPPLGPILLYEARESRAAGRRRALGPAKLEDRFGSADYDVVGPRRLALPADAAGDASRLVEYRVRRARHEPGFAERTAVPARTACGDLPVDLKQPSSLLAPAREGPPDLGAQPFLCYRAREGARARAGAQLDLADAWHQGRYELGRVTKLCQPIGVWGAAASSGPTRDLVCYEAKPARRWVAQDGCGAADPDEAGTRIRPAQEGPPRQRALALQDAFGPLQLDTRAPRELCLPAEPEP